MNVFIDEEKARNEVIELLKTLIRNKCVNDGTHAEEMRNIETIANYLDKYGIEYEIFESDKDRGNLLSTTKGDDGPRVMLGPSHVDVVPATDEGWDLPPFAAEEKDGYIYGRGAIDMLNTVASQVVAYAHLVTNPEFKPKGTLMLGIVADEEAGGKYGVEWLLKNHYEKWKADFAMTEAGGFSLAPNSNNFLMQVGEKGLYATVIRYKGRQGHGSMPLASDNALLKVAEAMVKLGKYKPPIEIQPFWKEFVGSFPISGLQKKLLTSKTFLPKIIKSLHEKQDPIAPLAHALTTMTISPNNIKGTIKFNVIPGDVTGEVDIRLLPGQDKEYADKHIRKALGKELYEKLEITNTLYFPGNASEFNTPLWDAMKKAVNELVPNSRITPLVIPAVTDGRFYRLKGTVTYGAYLFSPEESMKGFLSLYHGKNERISLKSLWLGTQFFAKTIKNMMG